MAFPSDGDMVAALGTESPTAAQSSAFANSDERLPTRPPSRRRKIAIPRRFRHEEQAYTPPIRPRSRRKSAKIVRFRCPSEESTPSASRAVTVMVDLEGQRANVMPSSEVPREIADAAPDGDLGSDA